MDHPSLFSLNRTNTAPVGVAAGAASTKTTTMKD
jgi:hypothetical protein